MYELGNFVQVFDKLQLHVQCLSKENRMIRQKWKAYTNAGWKERRRSEGKDREVRAYEIDIQEISQKDDIWQRNTIRIGQKKTYEKEELTLNVILVILMAVEAVMWRGGGCSGGGVSVSTAGAVCRVGKNGLAWRN
jgi:hypothetical protein